jgi:DNA polymerase-3 subunit delta
MQLLYDDINTGRLKPVYLFFGEEAWLMEEALQKLIQTVAPQNGAWGLEILDGSVAGPETVAAAALESSLFGGSRLVVVKNINWLEAAGKVRGQKVADADISAPLLAYLEAPNPGACLALTLRGSVDKRRKLVQSIQKKGRLIECVTPQGRERDIWLLDRFKAAGIKADRRAVAHISVSCANLSQMAAEAEKLMLFCADKGEITYEDALALVAESSLLTVFELTDATAAKNAAKACACFRRLLRQGEEEQKIFALLASQFRNMLLAQDLQKRGARPADIARELSLHPYVAEKCAQTTRAFSQRQLIKVLEMLLAADIAQKSGKGEMTELLETVILRICAM